MSYYVRKKKYLACTVEIRQAERYKPFEIKLPANIRKVTGVIITTSRIN